MGAWYGSKATSGLCQALIAAMPPHATYIETHLGGGAIMQRKPPALRNIGIDRSACAIRTFRCPYEVQLVHGCCHRFLSEFPFVGDELVYSDPPYLQRTRKSQRRYRYDYTQAHHEQLLALLKSLPCAVMLSGYPCELYERALPGWHSLSLQVMNQAGVVTEKLWCNFTPGRAVHWHRYAGQNFTQRQCIKRKAASWAKRYRGHGAGRAAGGAGRPAGGRGRVMPSVNDKYLREELASAKQQLKVLRKSGKVSPEADAVLRALLSLLALLVAVLLEKATRKTSRNSSIPPSQMDEPDDTRRAKPCRKPAKPNDLTSPNLQQVTIEETLTVEDCDNCGVDLSDVAALDRELRIEYDIVFRVVERRVEAELKQCPDCQALSKAAFPASMPGPLQYGSGLRAFIINLLVAHMLSLRRTVGLLKAHPACACPRPPA